MSDSTTITASGIKADNPYLPEIATIKEIINETPNIKSLRIVLNDADKMKKLKFEPGQVAQLSVFGAGESTFVINSLNSCKEYMQFSIMKAGENTSAIHELSEGDRIGFRGPLGSSFPYEDMKGRDIVFIAGGLGMAPLRPLLLYMLEKREDYGKIKLIYGAKTPDDLCFKLEIKEWQRKEEIEIVLTIDTPAPGWEYRVGFVPTVLAEEAPTPDNSIAVTCGPPIMIKFVLQSLEKLGFKDEQVYTTLERRMKCGIGICGRCNIGPTYVCLDGPVFNLTQLKELPNEM
ncbi:MAG: FAD/NAD(P)-binding protein [Thermodesulfobacteriota bacterium]